MALAPLQPPDLPPRIRVAMTGRQGGVSAPPYDSLNLGYHVGDDPAAVAANRSRAAGALELPSARAVFGEQVHGVRVARIAATTSGSGWTRAASAIPGTDALYTTQPEIALGILVADCFPVVIWDEAAGLIGVAHCGWRGVAAGLPAALLEEMARNASAPPSRCAAWIGAGIGPCCFQVGPEVMAELPDAPACPDPPGRWRLDLAACIADRLIAAGLAPHAITTAARCTACETDNFFSHRRATQQGLAATGRQALFAWME